MAPLEPHCRTRCRALRTLCIVACATSLAPTAAWADGGNVFVLHDLHDFIRFSRHGDDVAWMNKTRSLLGFDIMPGVMPLARTLNEQTHMTDARAFVAWLDQQPSVARNRRMGTQGYCMGGPMAFRTAAAMPDRVGAVASFHGGGLVTDQPNSPHVQASKTQAQFLVAIAANDDQRSPNDKTALKDTFDAAKRPAEIEVYTGAAHGWCPPDSGVYNEPLAERAWSRLLALYGKALA